MFIRSYLVIPLACLNSVEGETPWLCDGAQPRPSIAGMALGYCAWLVARRLHERNFTASSAGAKCGLFQVYGYSGGCELQYF